MENSVWHRIRGPQVSSDERIQILNEFYVRVIVSHLKRVHLCRVIRLIGPYITLDAAYGRYRRAANYLILYDFQLLHVVIRNLLISPNNLKTVHSILNRSDSVETTDIFN
ncbi:hypothetical protein QR98_0076920 [Sarcoptes scabiei]|uniref:Uncharacterized protein n=1 Tax=Sarcoptes scabiei TaxID=52283 RepID=A0A132AE78_SARSC|nr:hypothetical protein QR98_0076920 [Sarcoptes scabiei]